MTQSYPLKWPEGWPRTAPGRREHTHKFRNSTFFTTVEQLEQELRRLGASNAVLSTNLRIRLDGRPYSDDCDKRLDDPGVAIYFTLRGKPMSMARDLYDTVKDNLRSLTLAVEYMRGLERHGGAHMMERAFGGFGALPPPGGSATPDVDWRELLGPFDEDAPNYEQLAIAEARYRHKAKTAHSDHGGDGAGMIALNLAIAQARKELAA